MSLFLVPFAIERRTDARPVVTIALLATTLGLQIASAAGLVDPAALAFEWGAPTILDALASQVVHANFPHWLFNAIGLALFATTVEDAIGGRRFLGWLGVTVAAAILLEWAAFHRYEGSSYGSSGIVFACIGGALVLAPGTRLLMTFASLQHRRAWSLPMWAVAVLYAGYELWQWLKRLMVHDALRAGGEQVTELIAAVPMMHLDRLRGRRRRGLRGAQARPARRAGHGPAAASRPRARGPPGRRLRRAVGLRAAGRGVPRATEVRALRSQPTRATPALHVLRRGVTASTRHERRRRPARRLLLVLVRGWPRPRPDQPPLISDRSSWIASFKAWRSAKFRSPCAMLVSSNGSATRSYISSLSVPPSSTTMNL